MTEKAYAVTKPAGVAPATRRRLAPTWLAPLAAIVLAIIVTGVYRQVLHPFIEHDDWPYLLRQDQPGGSSIWARNESEGRWVNWLYWYLLGRNTSIVTASVVFFGSYAAFVWGMVRLLRLSRPVQVFLATFALMVSAMWIQLIYWPGTLSAAMIVAAVAVWSLPWVQRHRVALGAWMVVFVSLSLLTYPPVSALVLFAVIVGEYRSDVRRLLVLGVGFIASYGLGVLLVYGFNWLAFGLFGVDIAPWRLPNPLHSLADLTENVSRYAAQLSALGALLGVAWVVGVICLTWAIIERTTRRSGLILLGAIVILVGIEAGLTVLTGVVTGTRASLWAWPAICLSAALLLKGFRASRLAGLASLVVIALVGTLAWRADISSHQQTQAQYDALTDEVAILMAENPRDRVVKWMPPTSDQTNRPALTATRLSYLLSDRLGVFPLFCTRAECARIEAVAQQNPATNVFRVDDMTVVKIPAPPVR
jgi:hypothetical protein